MRGGRPIMGYSTTEGFIPGKDKDGNDVPRDAEVLLDEGGQND